MSRYQLRLLVVTGVAVVLLGLATFVLDWFSIDMLGTAIRISLRSVKLCAGPCESQSMSNLGGAYPTMAGAAFWCSTLLLLVLAAHTAIQLVIGVPNGRLMRFGTLLAVLVIITGAVAGYVVSPDAPSMGGLSLIDVHRTMAPLALVVGAVAAIYALGLTDSAGESHATPIIAKNLAKKPVAPSRPSSGKLEIVSTTPARPVPPAEPPPGDKKN